MNKERELDPRSVFVRGLSYEVGDAELNEAFSALGPVRHAFIIKDGKGGRHKGYGFVTYALQEDAERAVQELHGTDLGGRKIKVEGAKKRAPLEERKTKNKRKQTTEDDDEEAAPEDGNAEKPAQTKEKTKPMPAVKEPAVKKPRQAATAAAAGAPPAKAKRPAKDPEKVAKNLEKHSLVRTVAFGSLNPEIINAAISEIKAKGGETVEDIINPAPADVVQKHKLHLDGCTGDVILVRYKTAKDAMAAVATLHGQDIGSAKGKKKESSTGGGISLWARQVSGEGLHLKRWRVVVRNLSFNATEEALRTAFACAGFVWEVTVPRGADGKPRGFGFVGFTCRSHAERGIKLVNGTKIAGRPVAVDWAVAKRDYEQGAAAPAPAPTENEQEMSVSEDGYGSSDFDSDSEDEDGDKKKRRGNVGQEIDDDDVPALAPEEERGMLHSVIGDILGEEDSDEENIDEGDMEEVEEGDSEEEDEPMGDSKDEDTDEEDEEEEEAPEMGDMFSRKAIENNKSTSNAAVERLERRAEQFAAALEEGAAKKAPPPPGASVFVRGLSLDVTKDQLFLAMKAYGYVVSTRLVVDKVTGKSKGTAFVDYRYEDSAKKVVAACEKGRENAGPGVVIGGKKVEVDLALDSDGARKLAAEKGAAGLGPGGFVGDRRNIYLSKEGAIPEGSPAWEDLSASDKSKRKRAVEEAQTKLRSPNFCVSKNRLNVRNVPRSWDEKKLKAMFIAAVKERATKANPKVVQVKILKEDGVDGAKGEGRSKGIAFVEFDDHEHALCALRQLNNNPKPWGKDTRPIIEFAIDDVRALKKREARVTRTPAEAAQRAVAREEKAELKKQGAKERKAVAKEEREDGEGKSKRKLRAERRRMLKERQRAKQGKQAAAASPGAGGEGDVDNTNAGAAAGVKSARRREQRKRNKTDPTDTPKAVLQLNPKKPVSRGTGANAKVNKALERKQREDGLVDKLAASAGAGVAEGRVVKKRRRDTDRVERLAEAYVARTYGEGGGSKGKQKQQQQQGGEKRKKWFEGAE